MFVIGPLAPCRCRSPRMVWAMASLIPCTATRSTPVMRRICARVLTPGAFLLCECGVRRGGGAVAAGTTPAGAGSKRGVMTAKTRCDLRVARAELLGGEIKQRQRLGEDKQMFRTPGAGQRHRDLVRLLFTAGVTQGGQLRRVAFARDNSADDPPPGKRL